MTERDFNLMVIGCVDTGSGLSWLVESMRDEGCTLTPDQIEQEANRMVNQGLLRLVGAGTNYKVTSEGWKLWEAHLRQPAGGPFHPIDDCMLFMPRDDGAPSKYGILNRGCGCWGWCSEEQNAFLEANKAAHVQAARLRHLGPECEEKSWGGMEAFGMFVMPGLVRNGVKTCSKCRLPGHNVRTCKLPAAPEWIDPEEVLFEVTGTV